MAQLFVVVTAILLSLMAGCTAQASGRVSCGTYGATEVQCHYLDLPVKIDPRSIALPDPGAKYRPAGAQERPYGAWRAAVGRMVQNVTGRALAVGEDRLAAIWAAGYTADDAAAMTLEGLLE